MSEVPEDLAEQLRGRATTVQEQLTEKPLKRPIFVEFSGSPKSGKSTCIDIVAHFLRRLDFKVLAPTEGASKRTPYYLKDDLVAFNTWSACYALNHVLEGLYHSDRYHISILDRGLFDALVWFELLGDQGLISEVDRETVQRFLLIEKWRSVIDAVFLFSAAPETSMEREHRDKLIAEPGRAMNPDFLRELNEAYGRAAEKYSSDFAHFHRIDTSEEQKTTPRGTAGQVTRSILELVEGAASSG